jgi:hypothetical protein
MAKLNRVEIGFEGGPVVPARLDDGQLEDLKKALKNGESAHEFTSGDETVLLDLNKVIFVRIDSNESKVGF